MPTRFRVFHYTEPEMLSSDALGIARIAKTMASRIITDIDKSSQYEQVDILNKELEDRAQLHCDKWIVGTDTHMSLYSGAQGSGTKPLLLQPQSLPPSEQYRVSTVKSFSGDVSGVIGEAIFSLLLIKYFGLVDQDFAHFRADKRLGIYPDFGIYRVSARLESRLDWDGRSTICIPVPAEVKALTTATKEAVQGRLKKAILQIQCFQLQQRGTGIVCIAIRNQRLRSYDVALIWGR